MRVRRLYGSTRHCALAQISLGDSTTGPAHADQEIAIAPLLGCLRARGAADRPRGGHLQSLSRDDYGLAIRTKLSEENWR